MIDRKIVEWVSSLAKIDLSEKDIEEMSKTLTRIIDYMNILNELDLSGVEPTSHTLDLKNVMREDEVGNSFGIEEVKKLAPEWDRDHFVVPRII